MTEGHWTFYCHGICGCQFDFTGQWRDDEDRLEKTREQMVTLWNARPE